MEDIDPELVERYQKLYEEDPRSRIFAPLAESYRKMGLLQEGLEVAQKGVELHPEFPGGRVALGRLYADAERLEDAEKEFRKATALSPDNILAHQLLAEVLLKLKKSKEALKAYKMLLFLSPDNSRAQKAVQKLEALTADEYEDDLFAMKPLHEAVKAWDEYELDFENDTPASEPEISAQKVQSDEKKTKFLDRVLSLADAYIVRNDMDRAIEALNEAERLLGPHPEVIKRLKLIHHRQLDTMAHPQNSSEIQSPVSRERSLHEEKIEFLQDLLQKIKHRHT